MISLCEISIHDPSVGSLIEMSPLRLEAFHALTGLENICDGKQATAVIVCIVSVRFSVLQRIVLVFGWVSLSYLVEVSCKILIY